jgi:hypothetical protein
MDLRADPLRGAGGLNWYERAPSSLTREEWELLDAALGCDVIGAVEYADWKENVKNGPRETLPGI